MAEEIKVEATETTAPKAPVEETKKLIGHMLLILKDITSFSTRLCLSGLVQLRR